jgi:hypothetical protein
VTNRNSNFQGSRRRIFATVNRNHHGRDGEVIDCDAAISDAIFNPRPKGSIGGARRAGLAISPPWPNYTGESRCGMARTWYAGGHRLSQQPPCPALSYVSLPFHPPSHWPVRTSLCSAPVKNGQHVPSKVCMAPDFASFSGSLVSEREMGTQEHGAPWSSFVFADGKIVAGEILGSVRVVREAVLNAHNFEDTCM